MYTKTKPTTQTYTFTVSNEAVKVIGHHDRYIIIHKMHDYQFDDK